MVKFRPVTRKDISALQELAYQSWMSAYAAILSQEQIHYMLNEMYSAAVISAQLESQNYHYYFIVSDNENAGFIGFEHRYAERCTKLHRIYLLKEFIGKGLGKVSIDFLKETVKDFGDEKIILNVNKKNPAQKIYAAQGFTIYREEVTDIGNGFVMDDYLMQYII